MVNIDELKEKSAVVKSLLEVFDEDYVMKAIENGEITIDDDSDDEKDKKKSDDWKEGDEDKEKSEETTDTMKSMFADFIASQPKGLTQDDVLKCVTPFFKGMADTLSFMQSEISKIGEQAPGFKAEGLDKLPVVEKSLSLSPGEDGKIELSVTRQRPAVLRAIESLYSKADDSVQKSLASNVMDYSCNAYANTIGEELARYAFEKGYRFVQ